MVLLFSAPEEKADVVEMNDFVASTDLLKDAKGETEVLCEAMKPVCYIFNGDFRELEKLREAGIGEKLAQ